MNKSAADFNYSAYNLGVKVEDHGSFTIFQVNESTDQQETDLNVVNFFKTTTSIDHQNEVCKDVTHF